jgi:hypothetical protein
MNFDTADAMDDRYANLVNATAILINSHLKDVTTVGAIKRALPDSRDRYIWSALKSLKMVGEVDYDEHAPAPTRIYRRAMKRIERKVVPYNSEPIIHKDTKTYPTMAVSENYFRG